LRGCERHDISRNHVETSASEATAVSWRPPPRQRASERESGFARCEAAVWPAYAGARHFAGEAARLEPAQPALVAADPPGVREGAREVWSAAHRIQRAGEPPAPDHRGGRQRRALARHAGPRHPHRKGAERDDGVRRARLRRPLLLAAPALAHRAHPRHRVRAPEPRAPLRERRWAGRVQFSRALARRAIRAALAPSCAGCRRRHLER
jgi:hypothetical protein